MSRYNDRTIFTNNTKEYKETFKRRGIHKMRHYDTPTLKYPTSREIGSLDLQNHTWKAGDRLYKLAYAAYGDSELWWVIAWFNKTPTEADINFGDTIQIPFPLDRVIEMLDI